MKGKDPCTQVSSSSSRRKPTFGSAERKTPVKKLVSEFSKVKSKTPKHSPGKEESSGSLSETVCKRELRSQETPEKPRSLLETPLRASAPPKGPSAHPKEKGFFSSETDDLPYLSTTEMYLCRWHQPPPSPLPLREPSPKKEETVASKRWRTHHGTGGRRGRAGGWKTGFSTFALKPVKGKAPVVVGEVPLAALVPVMGSPEPRLWFTLLWHIPGLPLPARLSCGHHPGQGYQPCSALAARFAEPPAHPFERGVKQLPVRDWETCLWRVPPQHSVGSSTGSPAVPKSGALSCWLVWVPTAW